MEATGDIQRYQLQVDSGDPVEPSAGYSGQSWKLLGGLFGEAHKSQILG